MKARKERTCESCHGTGEIKRMIPPYVVHKQDPQEPKHAWGVCPHCGGGVTRMIVILIGPDLAGKTTLARLLQRVFECNRVKSERIANRQLLIDHVAGACQGNYPFNKRPVILDRWNYPDDMIYEPVVQGRKSILEDERKTIEESLQDHGVIFIHVTASQDTLEERFDKRGEFYVTKEQLNEIRLSYMKFTATTTLPVVTIDTSDTDTGEALRMAVHGIIKYKLRRVMEEENLWPTLRRSRR